MYCSYCGCKINSSAKKCPSCGKDAFVEYCGGFWGLVGENNSEVDHISTEYLAQEENTQNEKNYDEVRTKEKKILKTRLESHMDPKDTNRIKLLVCIGILGCLVLFCMIQTIRLHISNRTIVKLREEIETFGEHYNNLMNENKELEKKYSLLETDNKALNQKVSDLQKNIDTRKEEEQQQDNNGENTEINEEEKQQQSSEKPDDSMNIENKDEIEIIFDSHGYKLNPIADKWEGF